MLQAIIWSMDEQENWKRPASKKPAHDVAEAFGVHMKKVIIPILYASLTGKKHGPPLYDSVEILGKDRTRAQIVECDRISWRSFQQKMDRWLKDGKRKIA